MCQNIDSCLSSALIGWLIILFIFNMTNRTELTVDIFIIFCVDKFQDIPCHDNKVDFNIRNKCVCTLIVIFILPSHDSILIMLISILMIYTFWLCNFLNEIFFSFCALSQVRKTNSVTFYLIFLFLPSTDCCSVGSTVNASFLCILSHHR